MKSKTVAYDYVLKEYFNLYRFDHLEEAEYDYEKDVHMPMQSCIESVNKMLMNDEPEYHCLHCHSIFPESMLREDFLGNMYGCPRCEAAGPFDIRRSDQGDDFVAGVLLQKLVSPEEARKSGYEGVQIDWNKKEELYEKYYPKPDVKKLISKYFNLEDFEIEKHQVEIYDLQMIYELMQELEDLEKQLTRIDDIRKINGPKELIEDALGDLNKRIVDFHKAASIKIDGSTKRETTAISKLIDICLEREQSKVTKPQLSTIREIYEAAISSDNSKNDIFLKGYRLHGSGFSKQ